MIGDAVQYESQIGLWIQTVALGRAEQGAEHGSLQLRRDLIGNLLVQSAFGIRQLLLLVTKPLFAFGNVLILLGKLPVKLLPRCSQHWFRQRFGQSNLVLQFGQMIVGSVMRALFCDVVIASRRAAKQVPVPRAAPAGHQLPWSACETNDCADERATCRISRSASAGGSFRHKTHHQA